jgi:hypothetical protein
MSSPWDDLDDEHQPEQQEPFPGCVALTLIFLAAAALVAVMMLSHLPVH